jgi:hypothetical protein
VTDEAPWLLPYLPPLPPRDPGGDGYDWMDRVHRSRWAPIPSWGRDGWDLGDWPLVIVATTVVAIDVEEPRPVRRPERCIHCRQALTMPGPVWVAVHGGAECPATFGEHVPARQARAYGVATYVEGDIDVRAYAEQEERLAAIDDIAAFYWRLQQSHGPENLPPVGPLPVEYTGPFSWERCQSEATA